MSTAPCPSCRWDISIAARRCPRCDCPITTGRLLADQFPRLSLGILLFCLAYLGYCYASCTLGR